VPLTPVMCWPTSVPTVEPVCAILLVTVGPRAGRTAGMSAIAACAQRGRSDEVEAPGDVDPTPGVVGPAGVPRATVGPATRRRTAPPCHATRDAAPEARTRGGVAARA
jgi:hypothetical protein